MKNTTVRCPWVPTGNTLYENYHDQEWGIPVHNDRVHFEFLILEGAQAGLSWLTILQRREGYRKAFAHFDPQKVARFDDQKLNELIHNEAIIRNRLKISSCIQNAKQFLLIQKEYGSFDHYIWQFVDGKPIKNHWKTMKEIPCESEESRKISHDLRKRGFNFVGSKIMYAYMQATGLVNDHTIDCFCYTKR